MSLYSQRRNHCERGAKHHHSFEFPAVSHFRIHHFECTITQRFESIVSKELRFVENFVGPRKDRSMYATSAAFAWQKVIEMAYSEDRTVLDCDVMKLRARDLRITM
jgi:hypothetical protein